MMILEIVATVLALTIFAAIFLWVAMKIVRVDGSFLALLIASFVTVCVAQIPYVGGILALGVLLFLLYQFTDMSNWLLGLIVVLLARLLAILSCGMIDGMC